MGSSLCQTVEHKSTFLKIRVQKTGEHRPQRKANLVMFVVVFGQEFYLFSLEKTKRKKESVFTSSLRSNFDVWWTPMRSLIYCYQYQA